MNTLFVLKTLYGMNTKNCKKGLPLSHGSLYEQMMNYKRLELYCVAARSIHYKRAQGSFSDFNF